MRRSRLLLPRATLILSLLLAVLVHTKSLNEQCSEDGKQCKCDATDKAAALTQWATEHGATLDKISLAAGGTRNCSVVAFVNDAVAPGDTILRLPYTLSITAQTLSDQAASDSAAGPAAETAELLRLRKDVGALPPSIALMAALLREVALGKSSFWAPYLAVLPALPPPWPSAEQRQQYVPVPLFDDEDGAQLALLKGTQAFEPARVMLGERQSTWRDVIRPLCLSHPVFFNQTLFTLPRWYWAYGIVSSRAFSGPSAESQATAGAENVHASDSTSDRGLRASSGLSLVPVLDIADHAPSPASRRELSTIVHTTLAKGAKEQDKRGQKQQHGRVVRAAFAQQPGETWFNDYGALTSSKLLLMYGFVLDPEVMANPDDRYTLSWTLPVRRPGEKRGSRISVSRRQRELLLRHGLAIDAPREDNVAQGGRDQGVDGDALIATFELRRGELDDRLVRFLRIFGLSAREAKASGGGDSDANGTDCNAERTILQGAAVSLRSEHRACRHLIFSVLQVLRQLPVLPAELTLAKDPGAMEYNFGFSDLANKTLLKYRAEQRSLLEANVKLAEGMWRRLLRSADVS